MLRGFDVEEGRTTGFDGEREAGTHAVHHAALALGPGFAAAAGLVDDCHAEVVV